MTDKTDSKERITDEMVHAALKVKNPTLYQDHLRHPSNGPVLRASTEKEIQVTRKMLEAALGASLAANAGSEPVAWIWKYANGEEEVVFVRPERVKDMHPDTHDMPSKITPLYLHPSPPEGMVGGWIALPGTLPEPGVPVLLDIGKKYPIRAMWAAKFTLPVSLEDDSGFGEHDERTDEWYCPEGWYEWNEHEETNWAVSATPRAWAPLPPTSSADSRKGE